MGAGAILALFVPQQTREPQQSKAEEGQSRKARTRARATLSELLYLLPVLILAVAGGAGGFERAGQSDTISRNSERRAKW